VGLARFHRLGDWSLWYDECLTLADGWHGAGNYNPLAYAVIRATAELLGGRTDELALRLAPALAGWLVIPLTFWAFRPAAGDRRAALAAFLVALSPWQLYWSQNARFYTLVEVPALLGTGLCLRGLLGGRRVTALAGLVVVAAGTTLQLQAALLTGALAFAPWIAARLARSGDAPARRAAGVLALVGALVVLASLAWVGGAFGRYAEMKPVDPLASVLHLAQSTAFFLTPTLAVGALVGGIAILRERDFPGLLALLIPLLVGGAATAAAAFAQGSAQYVFVAMPFVALLAVWPLESAPLARSAGARLALVALLAAAPGAGSGLYFGVRHGERPRWREAYGLVDELRAEGDAVAGMQGPVGEYYLRPGSTDLRHPRSVVWIDRTRPYSWAPLARGERALWLVVRPDFLQLWGRQERRDFAAFLREECRLVRRFDVHLEGRDLDLEVYHRP